MSVRLSVSLTHTGVLSKQLNISSNYRRMQEYEKITIFSLYLKMIQNKATLTMADQNGTTIGRPLCCLSNGAIFTDLEQHLTRISRHRLYLTVNYGSARVL